MIDFGYTFNPSSRINLDNFDRVKFNKLVEIEPDVKTCMACGSCCASCSAGKYTPTSLRSAILALQNGLPEKALDYLKGCMLCGKCTIICPRGINTRHLIISITKIYSAK